MVLIYESGKLYEKARQKVNWVDLNEIMSLQNPPDLFFMISICSVLFAHKMVCLHKELG